MKGYRMPKVEISSCYAAGLVAKKDMPYVKDSIDLISLAKVDDRYERWGIEVKARITLKRQEDEVDWMKKIGRRDKVLSIQDVVVFRYLQEVAERVQILHHAYVWSLDTVAFLVGDSQSEIIQATVVDYSDELKEAYGMVLEDIYNLSLSWAYQDDQDLNPIGEMIPDIVRDLADEIETINGFEAFCGAFGLWKEMFLSKHRRPLPMPSLRRIIPSSHAFWNAVKSGSDTCTKLMDSCRLIVPNAHSNCETRASSRIIMLGFVAIHRLRQMFTSSKSLQ